MKNLVSKEKTRIYTKLKFVISEQTGAVIGFVSQNSVSGQIRGVRQEENVPKKICVVDKALSPYILLNVLYECTLIPMNGNKDGYVVIEATPVQFPATIVTTYVPKGVYMVEVKFGNKTILFDPKDGEKKSVRDLATCIQLLEKRVDVKDLCDVVSDFEKAANKLLNKYRNDGFFYKK